MQTFFELKRNKDIHKEEPFLDPNLSKEERKAINYDDIQDKTLNINKNDLLPKYDPYDFIIFARKLVQELNYSEKKIKKRGFRRITEKINNCLIGEKLRFNFRNLISLLATLALCTSSLGLTHLYDRMNRNYLGGNGVPETGVEALPDDTIFYSELPPEQRESPSLIIPVSDNVDNSEGKEILATPTNFYSNLDDREMRIGYSLDEVREKEVLIEKKTFFEKGFNLYIDINSIDPENHKSVQDTVKELHNMGVTHLNINFPLFVKDGYSSSFSDYKDESRTPSNDLLISVIKEAKNYGMEVSLRPCLDERSLSSTGHWRGDIEPYDVDAWFKSYEEKLDYYLTHIVIPYEVETLYIGVELTTMQYYNEEWSNLIKKIREKAPEVKLTYSATFSNKGRPDFFSELDFLTLDIFFRHDHLPNVCTVEEKVLRADFKKQLKDLIDSYKEKWPDLKIKIGEIGTTSQQCSYRASFVWDHEQEYDAEDQNRYMIAVINALIELSEEEGNDYIYGLYIWAVDFYKRGQKEASFNPAEETIDTISYFYKNYYPQLEEEPEKINKNTGNVD